MNESMKVALTLSTLSELIDFIQGFPTDERELDHALTLLGIDMNEYAGKHPLELIKKLCTMVAEIKVTEDLIKGFGDMDE